MYLLNKDQANLGKSISQMSNVICFQRHPIGIVILRADSGETTDRGNSCLRWAPSEL